MDTLAFGYILPTTGRIRDFNPLETCAAGRTILKEAAHYGQPLLYNKIFITDICPPILFLTLNLKTHMQLHHR